MPCKTGDGETWTTVRVREVRERLGIPEYDPEARSGTTIILVSFSDFCGARPSNGSSARLQALRCQFKQAFECV